MYNTTLRILHPILHYLQYFVCEQLDHDPGAPSQLAWRRELNKHADFLTEFRVTFMEAVRMVRSVKAMGFVRANGTKDEQFIFWKRAVTLSFSILELNYSHE